MTPDLPHLTRRTFLGNAARGVGAVALGSLLNPASLFAAQKWRGILAAPHFPPKAKRVIWLTMAGGPSHLETFDHKPKLAEMHGKPMPESITKGQQIAQLQGKQLNCFGPQWAFKKFGQCGAEICELFPHIGSVADDICFIRSMTTDAINHDPAHMLHEHRLDRSPAARAWARGSRTASAARRRNCPASSCSPRSARAGRTSPSPRGSGARDFCRAASRASQLREQRRSRPLPHAIPPGVSREQQGDVIDAVNKLNAQLRRRRGRSGNRHAHRAVRDGVQDAGQRARTDGHGEGTAERPRPLRLQARRRLLRRNCLLARRLAERGVRFIQLYHKDWDHHGGVKDGIKLKAEEVDRACMALITDLKQRGMFDDTLVVWAGEFGRTPMSQGGSGRDHHILGFTTWMAGGGIKGGTQCGETDEFGYKAVKDVVHVHDMHATMLHQLGIDHTKLVFRTQGRDYRLTDVFGKVVKGILA